MWLPEYHLTFPYKHYSGWNYLECPKENFKITVFKTFVANMTKAEHISYRIGKKNSQISKKNISIIIGDYKTDLNMPIQIKEIQMRCCLYQTGDDETVIVMGVS